MSNDDERIDDDGKPMGVATVLIPVIQPGDSAWADFVAAELAAYVGFDVIVKPSNNERVEILDAYLCEIQGIKRMLLRLRRIWETGRDDSYRQHLDATTAVPGKREMTQAELDYAYDPKVWE
jgi:hypothetical protein